MVGAEAADRLRAMKERYLRSPLSSEVNEAADERMEIELEFDVARGAGVSELVLAASRMGLHNLSLDIRYRGDRDLARNDVRKAIGDAIDGALYYATKS